VRKFAALGGTSVLVLSLATIVPAAVGPVPPAAATPIPTCSAPAISGTTATVTCPVGVDDTWTVPPGVGQATFDLQGAAGGARGTVAVDAGGTGGRTTAAVGVTAGTT